MAQDAPKQEKQKAGAAKKKQNEPNKKNGGKQPEVVDLDNDFDMLEDIFKMGESPVAQPKKVGKGQKQPLQELDPTMAVSANHITIIEEKPTDYVRSFNMKQDIADNEFEEDFGAGDKQFDFSFHFKALQYFDVRENIEPELPMDFSATPEELRGANASNRELPQTLISSGFHDDPMGQESSLRKRASVKRPYPEDEEASTSNNERYAEMPLTLPEDSLCGDIMNIVSKQMKPRKRRASADLSTRVEASMGSRLEEAEVADVNNHLEFPAEITNFGESLVPIASSTPYKPSAENKDVVEAESNEEDFVVPSKQVPKKRAIQRKNCVDKVTKLPLESLTQRTTYYENHLMLPPPLANFEKTFFRIKVTNEPYLMTPSSCLRRGGEKLKSLFTRNLKRIPQSVKRQLPDPEPAAAPAKKSRASRKASVKEPTPPPVTLDSIEIQAAQDFNEVTVTLELDELPVTLDPLEVPSLDELAPEIPEPQQLAEISEPQFAEEQEVAVAKPTKKTNEFAAPKSAKKASGAPFKER